MIASQKLFLAALEKGTIVAGEKPWREAAPIYTRFDLKNRVQTETTVAEEWPQIVCSIALI